MNHLKQDFLIKLVVVIKIITLIIYTNTFVK